MYDRNLLTELATVIGDYRGGELPTPTAEHVQRWLLQFPNEHRAVVLSESLHLLRQTYLSQETADRLLARLLFTELSTFTRSAWIRSLFLEIQSRSRSQSMLVSRVRNLLAARYGDAAYGSDPLSDTAIYFDDVIGTGKQTFEDLSAWFSEIGSGSTFRYVYVVALVDHSSSYFFRNKLIDKSRDVNVKVFWLRHTRYEDRLSESANSRVLFPMALPSHPAVDRWVRELGTEAGKLTFRTRDGATSNTFFSSPEARALIEEAFLVAGAKIYGFANQANALMRPLGFKSLVSTGFGTMASTSRNCPNNSPLALWYGDPAYADTHPFGRWYPLMQRRGRLDVP